MLVSNTLHMQDSVFVGNLASGFGGGGNAGDPERRPGSTALKRWLPWVFVGTLVAMFLLGAGVDHLAPVMGLLRGAKVVRVEDAGMADQMVEYALLATLAHQRRWHPPGPAGPGGRS